MQFTQPEHPMSSSETMRAVLIRGDKGDADALYLGDALKPSPAPGQVLVRIAAFGLNRMDILQRQGAYPGTLRAAPAWLRHRADACARAVPKGASKILGVEFSGVVELVGAVPSEDDESEEARVLRAAIGQWTAGDEVYGLAYGVRTRVHALSLHSFHRY
jgi:NADPH:quinone reductase-like Zn-dependent oxidoreductase